MEFETQAIINRELTSAERVMWTGQPKKGLKFRKQDTVIVLFMAVWLGTLITFFGKSAWETGPLMAKVVLAFMLGAGLYMLIGRFFVDAWTRSKTYYGLTTQRAMIVTETWSKSVKSVYLNNIVEMDVSKESDDSGTITFGRPDPASSAWASAGRWSSSRRVLPAPAFDMIENVQHVYDQIMNLRKQATS